MGKTKRNVSIINGDLSSERYYEYHSGKLYEKSCAILDLLINSFLNSVVHKN